ncbi:MAG: DnaJ domain-containing protein [Candidatus Omnitrophica bacterium]|nr:DnaJ domain-containing protein [Candidatus Omnitrophota bacterium]
MDLNTAKAKLSNLVISRDITKNENLKYIRDWISSWSDQVPHHGINQFGETVEFLSITEVPTYVIFFDIQYERRVLKTGVWPYFGKEIFSKSISLNDPSELWSVNVPLIENFKTQVNCYAVQGSEKFAICNSCRGGGKVPCPMCGGRGEVSCPTCGGRGEISCPRCGGKTTEPCHRCGGNGSIKGDSSINYREITCPSCGGRQRVPCSSCGGKGKEDCSKCRNGTVVCYKCAGNGILTCGSCKGSGKFISLVYLSDSFIHKPWIKSIHFSQIPSEIASRITNGRNSGELIAEYEDRLIPDDMFESSNHVALKHDVRNFLQTVRNVKVLGVYLKNYRILKEKIVVKKVNVMKIDYKHTDRQYAMWLYGKSSVWAPVSPISEYRDNLFSDAKREFGNKAFSRALSLIDKTIEMSSKKEYNDFRDKIVNKIHQQYIVGAVAGGTIFPLIGNISGVFIGLILRNHFSTRLNSEKKRFAYSFWTSFIVNLIFALTLFLIKNRPIIIMLFFIVEFAVFKINRKGFIEGLKKKKKTFDSRSSTAKEESASDGYDEFSDMNSYVFIYYSYEEKNSVEKDEFKEADGYDKSRSQDKGKKAERDYQMSLSDCYEILGVSESASTEEIKAAYRKRIMEYHPDRTGGLGEKLKDRAEEETKKINNAFEKIMKSKG